MNATKCDICNKQIKDKENGISAGFGNYFSSHFEFCEKCGKPIRDFLKKNNFSDKYENINEKIKKTK